MKNYLLEYSLEDYNKNPSCDLSYIELLESLVNSAAKFSGDFDKCFVRPSLFDYGSILEDHWNGSCIQNNLRVLVYASLLRKAVEDANAIALLRSKSLWSQALNLWRSLFETEVVCRYISNSSLDDHLACRYAIHSMLRKTVRRWESVNETCRRLGKKEEYSAEEIQLRKDAYWEEFGFGYDTGDYAWTRKKTHNNFSKIAEATKSDVIFYRIASNEVHPTFGEDVMSLSMSLPMLAVPLLPGGSTFNSRELLLEFQTAQSLSNVISRVTDYTDLSTHLEGSLTALKERAEAVLRDLSETKASAGEAKTAPARLDGFSDKGDTTKGDTTRGLLDSLG